MGHAGGMSTHRDGVSHWDDVYAGGDASRSWFQACPLMSLKMLDATGVTASDSLIDVGGGASRLAGALLVVADHDGLAGQRRQRHGSQPNSRIIQQKLADGLVAASDAVSAAWLNLPMIGRLDADDQPNGPLFILPRLTPPVVKVKRTKYGPFCLGKGIHIATVPVSSSVVATKR
jgi:hypothetical protein